MGEYFHLLDESGNTRLSFWPVLAKERLLVLGSSQDGSSQTVELIEQTHSHWMSPHVSGSRAFVLLFSLM